MKYRPSLIDVIWIVVQVALIVIYLIDWPWLNEVINDILTIIGAIPMVVGAIMVIWGLIQLRHSLNIFPSPRPDGKLITSGIYRSVRHPIYGGLIFLAFGYALFEWSIYKLVLAFVLYLFFSLKANYEERKLLQKYPGYVDYRLQAGKFFPYTITFFKKKQDPTELEIAETIEEAEVEDEEEDR